MAFGSATIFLWSCVKEIQPFFRPLHLYCNKKYFSMKFFKAIFLLFFPFFLFGQGYKLDQRYPGYFINAKGDTIRGWILLTNKLDNQQGSEYSNDAKAEKLKFFLMPDEVKGFKVKDRVYTSVVYGDPDPKPEHFLFTLAEGELKLYQYFRLSRDLYVGTGTGQRPAVGDDEQYLQSEFVIMNKSGKQFVIFSQGSFMKNAEEIFEDNKELLQKINDKEKGFRYIDLPAIVGQYNSAGTGK